jgi:hypothetical protein
LAIADLDGDQRGELLVACATENNTVDQDITDDFESMPEAWPKALAILKALSEARAQ